MRSILLIALSAFLAIPAAFAETYVLPVFAVRVDSAGNTQWTSEVYVTNPGPAPVLVQEGAFLPGRISNDPPCLPIVQPFLEIPPQSTVLWRTGDLEVGIGCPEFAVGGLLFTADQPVEITSRMVNHRSGEVEQPLSGKGQEISAVALSDLPSAESLMILPAIGWHPNACGPRLVETNVFFANGSDTPVTVRLEPAPDQSSQFLIDGALVDAPFTFSVDARAQRVFRLAGPDAPQLPVCLGPEIGSFRYRADGAIAVVASIVDRRSGDARTSVPVAARD